MGCSFATPGRGSRVRFPATPGWGPPAVAVAVSVAEGFPVLCVLVARRMRVVSVLLCVVCVLGVCVVGGAGVGVCVCVCVCVVCWWRVVAGPCLHKLLLGLVGLWLVCAVMVPSPLLAESPVCNLRNSWLGLAAGGGGCPLRLLAEGPGCGSPPLLAGVRRWWWCAVPCHSWLRVLVAAPRHSWLGSVGCVGVFRGSGCLVLCVFVACVAARGGGAVLCVVCLWCPCCWWFGVVVRRGCVFGVRWCAWLCVRGVPVVCGLLSPPLLVWGSRLCLCGCGWRAVWVPCHSLLRDLGAVPRRSWLGSAVVRWWLVPCHSWLRGLVAGPCHSWRGFAAGCGGRSLATPGRGPRAWFPATPGRGPPVVVLGACSPLLVVGPGCAFLLGPGECVCAVCHPVLVWVVCGGRARCGCRMCVCVCVCVRCVVCGVCHTLVGSHRRSAWSRPKGRGKAKGEVL